MSLEYSGKIMSWPKLLPSFWLLGSLSFSACSNHDASQSAAAKSSAAPNANTPKQSLIFSAAASTKEVMEALAKEFAGQTRNRSENQSRPVEWIGKPNSGRRAGRFVSVGQSQWADE